MEDAGKSEVTKRLRAIFTVAPENGEFPIVEAIVEDEKGRIHAWIRTATGAVEVVPEKGSMEVLLRQRDRVTVQGIPVMVPESEEVKDAIGKRYEGPVGWGAYQVV